MLDSIVLTLVCQAVTNIFCGPVVVVAHPVHRHSVQIYIKNPALVAAVSPQVGKLCAMNHHVFHLLQGKTPAAA